MVKVAALVVDWNTPHDLERLIDSACACEPTMHWSIWRNYHDSFTAPYRFQAYMPYQHSVMSSTQNHGHGYGINRAAIRAAELWQPEYFLVINPDCLFKEPIVNELIAFMEQDPNRWIVGPKQLDSRMRITAGGIFGTDTKPKHRHWMTPDPKNALARDSQKAIMAAGSAFLIRAETFNFLGGMLEAKHYYSDTWLSYHARAHGGEVWYHGKAWLIHEWHRSSPVGFDGTDGNFKKDREMFRKFCREHDPPIVCE